MQHFLDHFASQVETVLIYWLSDMQLISLAAEAELGEAYINACKAMAKRIILQELAHHSPAHSLSPTSQLLRESSTKESAKTDKCIQQALLLVEGSQSTVVV